MPYPAFHFAVITVVIGAALLLAWKREWRTAIFLGCQATGLSFMAVERLAPGTSPWPGDAGAAVLLAGVLYGVASLWRADRRSATPRESTKSRF